MFLKYYRNNLTIFLVSIKLPTTTDICNRQLPSSVKNIGTYAFSGCTNLTEVILPDGLENIGYAAFMSSGIKEITVPKSVKNIGQDAFLN